MIQKHDKYFIDIARQVAAGSKCKRAKFGSVIVSADKRRIISTGFNGKPCGSTCDNFCFREGLPPNTPGHNCCIHSEANAIMFSSPLERKGATIYVTGKPCNDCTLAILQSGITRLVHLVPETGHPGWAGEDVVAKYGVPLEVCEYREEEWTKLYGNATG